MKLNNNCFPINISFKDAKLKFMDVFRKKKHSINEDELNTTNIYLNIIPYYFYYYDIDYNDSGTYKHITGQCALNTLTNFYDEEVLSFFNETVPTFVEELKVKDIENYKIYIKDKIVTMKDAEINITKKLSAIYNVSKESITLSGGSTIYVPMWKYVNIYNRKYYMDAVTGKINNFNEIKYKEKTNKEIFGDMISDIKSPKNIFIYFKNSFLMILNFFKKINKKLLLIIFLIIVLIIIYFFL